MAGKTPGTRKSASPKKATKQKSAVTPIDQGNFAANRGNSPVSDGNTQAVQGHSQAANEGSHGVSQGSNGNKAENAGYRPTEQGIIELIRIRAYELFEERGRAEGYHQEDWARAEAEILAKFEREKSA
ncbi:MAG TPA: DUF2934 domain-containing protein [Candidatus Angelobacter sp.]|nr:DUF2934 domain-containing protein [Candidatus Angelobacter sp.]